MKMTLKAMMTITFKWTTVWMQNYKGNSLHLPERKEKTEPTVNSRNSQASPTCIFFSVITYSKILPSALHIALVCQTSLGLLRTEKPLPTFTFYLLQQSSSCC